MHDLRAAGRLRPGTQTLLIGFGVGLSWAGCSWTETWQPRQVPRQLPRSTAAASSTRPSNGKAHIDARSNGKHAADAVKAARPE